MNIYQKIENFIKEESKRPSWVDEILYELKEIKRLLKEDHQEKNRYYRFLTNLKDEFKNAIQNNKKIKIKFNNHTYSINLKGYIYDVATKKEVSAKKAFEIFRFLYHNQKALSRYLEFEEEEKDKS